MPIASNMDLWKGTYLSLTKSTEELTLPVQRLVPFQNLQPAKHLREQLSE